MKSATKFVSYIRVSTSRQGLSGLGLEAQRDAVSRYIRMHEGLFETEFVEVESGKKTNRRQLNEAIAYCKHNGATLIIAKLDRLARNVHFISGLIETGVQFRAADMPSADKFMLHIYAAMAEEEGRRISERTKQALAAAKRRGVVLGSSAKVLSQLNKLKADNFSLDVGKRIEMLKEKGYSIRKIAIWLNSAEIHSYSGGKWHSTAVQRTWKRYVSLTSGNTNTPPCHIT